eukprot:1533438-Rhodomonas_salina.1
MPLPFNRFSLLGSESDDEANGPSQAALATSIQAVDGAGEPGEQDLLDAEEEALVRLLQLPPQAEQIDPGPGLTLHTVRSMDPWRLCLRARKQIHQLLVQEHRAICSHMYTQKIAQLEGLYNDLAELRQSEQARFLKTQHIIGATVTGMSKYSAMICAAEPKILVLEVCIPSPA